MESATRWFEAQRYELGFWESMARQIDAGSMPALTWYQWRAEELRKRLERLNLHRLTSGRANIVEVGSGPVGVCTYFPGAERVAVDPLMESYARYPTLVAIRDPKVRYRQGVGERLPLPSGRYDLAIVDNCIDHVQDVHGVMRELSRVLKPDGVLYLTVNNRTRAGYYVHRLLSRLYVDRGHPHTFTPQRTLALLQQSGFEARDVEIGSYLEATREDLRSGRLRARLKALLGVSEYLVSVIADHAAFGAGTARPSAAELNVEAARRVA